MTGSSVIANFAHAVASATSLPEVTTTARTFAKDIQRAGVSDVCALILTRRRVELRS
ncbi:hypothetical protein [Stappia sp.]|uniref:hypothetical protein n=1 Tax=Stappia sp. TaxID=1870903 RepID=UPI003C7B795F